MIPMMTMVIITSGSVPFVDLEEELVVRGDTFIFSLSACSQNSFNSYQWALYVGAYGGDTLIHISDSS